MSAIFADSVGKVIAIQDSTIPATIESPLADLSFESQGAIITRLAISEQCSRKLTHTLGSLVHIYVFGDRMGVCGVSGLVFSQKCEGQGGPDKLRQYYLDNRLAKKSAPLKITLGAGTTLEAFLLGYQLDTADPAAKIFQFDLQFDLIPDET